MKYKFILVISILSILFSVISPVIAKGQKFISVEPHMGYGNNNYFYAGGKVYTYEGENISRKAYYNCPNMIAKFQGQSIQFTPDSEGFFWLKINANNNPRLTYGTDNLNSMTVSLSEDQTNLNKNLVLVTEYGLNTDSIEIPFIIPSNDCTFGIISDFDDTVTTPKSFDIIRYITTDTSVFKLREDLVSAYNKMVNGINPIYYVTSRPNGTYRVVKTIISENKLPLGPILARNLGFWFLNKGVNSEKHKTSNIESILNSLPNKPFILIGDNSRFDPSIYIDIQKRYPQQVLRIFIFNNTYNKTPSNQFVSYIRTPEEMIRELSKMGLLKQQ